MEPRSQTLPYNTIYIYIYIYEERKRKRERILDTIFQQATLVVMLMKRIIKKTNWMINRIGFIIKSRLLVNFYKT